MVTLHTANSNIQNSTLFQNWGFMGSVLLSKQRVKTFLHKINWVVVCLLYGTAWNISVYIHTAYLKRSNYVIFYLQLT